MRSKEVEEAIKNCNMLLAGDITVHIIDDDGGTAYAGQVNKTYNDDLKTVLSYIETLEQLPNKIRDKIEELKEEQAFYERCGNDEMVDRYRVFKQVLKEIVGE